MDEDNNNLSKNIANGDERIAVLKHGFNVKTDESGKSNNIGIELNIYNISTETIASALFETVFYDREGKILDIVECKTVDWRFINSSLKV